MKKRLESYFKHLWKEIAEECFHSLKQIKSEFKSSALTVRIEKGMVFAGLIISFCHLVEMGCNDKF